MAYPQTIGVVLAGGLARRMGGGDKARIRIGGVTVLERIIERLRPQCAGLILNANTDAARFADIGLPVVADSVPDYAGPLAGILAGLDWTAEHATQIEWIVSAPGDCPFLPRDLVTRLHQARVGASAAPRLRQLGKTAASGRCDLAGRSCARTCGVRSPATAYAGSPSGARAIRSEWQLGRRRPSIRSSTSTSPKMSPRPNAWRHSIRTRDAVSCVIARSRTTKQSSPYVRIAKTGSNRNHPSPPAVPIRSHGSASACNTSAMPSMSSSISTGSCARGNCASAAIATMQSSSG